MPRADVAALTGPTIDRYIAAHRGEHDTTDAQFLDKTDLLDGL
jgi:hypothetical protein